MLFINTRVYSFVVLCFFFFFWRKLYILYPIRMTYTFCICFSIIFCLWILTSLCWFLTGFDFFLHTWVNYRTIHAWIINVIWSYIILFQVWWRCVNYASSFADDACSAFEDFAENPQNSSLGSMLPCINESFSGKLMAEIGNTIHRFVVEVKKWISIPSFVVEVEKPIFISDVIIVSCLSWILICRWFIGS